MIRPKTFQKFRIWEYEWFVFIYLLISWSWLRWMIRSFVSCEFWKQSGFGTCFPLKKRIRHHFQNNHKKRRTIFFPSFSDWERGTRVGTTSGSLTLGDQSHVWIETKRWIFGFSGSLSSKFDGTFGYKRDFIKTDSPLLSFFHTLRSFILWMCTLKRANEIVFPLSLIPSK